MLRTLRFVQVLATDFVLVAEGRGLLRLPEELVAELALQDGELLAAEVGAVSVQLTLFRDFLKDNWIALAPAIRWRFLEAFLRRPLFAVRTGQVLAIDPEIFAFEAGDQLLLQLADRGLSRVLYLYRLDLPPTGSPQKPVSSPSL